MAPRRVKPPGAAPARAVGSDMQQPPAGGWAPVIAGARGDTALRAAGQPHPARTGEDAAEGLLVSAAAASMHPVAALTAPSIAAGFAPLNSAEPLRALLHLADFGIALLDASGAVSFANDHARAMFEAPAVISMRRKQLQCSVSNCRQIFEQARDGQCEAARERRPCPASVLRIPHPVGHGHTVLKFQQLTAGHAGFAEPWVVVFMFDSPRPRSNAQHTLRELYGLSVAESKVAHLLADGCDIPDIARRMNIAKNTVRAHLRSTYAKTGIKKQAQLVAQLCRDLLALESLLR